jgi:hypothetical protein
MSTCDISHVKLSNPHKGKLWYIGFTKLSIQVMVNEESTSSHDNVGINNRTFKTYLTNRCKWTDKYKVKVMVKEWINLSYIYLMCINV